MISPKCIEFCDLCFFSDKKVIQLLIHLALYQVHLAKKSYLTHCLCFCFCRPKTVIL